MADEYTMIRSTSVDEIRELASFPIKLPTFVPDGFTLRLIRQHWPPHIDEAAMARKVHADFVDALYVNGSGDRFLVTQGFIARFIGFALNGLAPDDSSGSIMLNDRSAVWLTAAPVGDLTHDAAGRHVSSEWKRGAIACIGWEDAIVPPPDGGSVASRRYYSLDPCHCRSAL